MSREFNLRDQVPAILAINAERQRQGMSLGDMEERSGVSVGSVYAWRSGKRSPQTHMLVALAGTLGYEIIMRRKKI
ncbi:helix-turn-helix domain-containing protein [Agrobacterium larrymoorei]|uniref:helix-turn-helix domain-containing protein n=1 Tax=Agrobacterium larrymoorei TaxID=160699 RepID=UPI003CC917DB